jgi:hypothetical protein
VPAWGEIDFTPVGAALHRTVSEEFLGPGWADGLSVWAELDREEHRYGHTEQDIQSAVKECQNRGEEVVASRLMPIAPWCVWLGERFPHGYRLELVIRRRGR